MRSVTFPDGRSVPVLGAKGALVNGYTNAGGRDTARYLDEPETEPFWAQVAERDVPVYLHPREPLPGQLRIYEGYSSLAGSANRRASKSLSHCPTKTPPRTPLRRETS